MTNAPSTIGALIERHKIDVDQHLDRELEIPLLAEPQAQGDLLIAPLSDLADQVTVESDATWNMVPSAGTEVMRGAGGHAHTLTSSPSGASWTTDVRDTEMLALGVLEATSPTWLAHLEHGYSGIAPGRYVIRRQREKADEIRMVAD